MKFAKENDVRIAISLESPPMINKNRAQLRDIVSRADVLFANEEKLEAFTGSRQDEAARALAEDIDTVCLKKGEKGSVIFSRGERSPIPCYSVKVVDTTGAGDFYAAGVLFGLSRGQPAEAAGHVGAKLAAKTVETFGATLNRKPLMGSAIVT